MPSPCLFVSQCLLILHETNPFIVQRILVSSLTASGNTLLKSMRQRWVGSLSDWRPRSARIDSNRFQAHQKLEK